MDTLASRNGWHPTVTQYWSLMGNIIDSGNPSQPLLTRDGHEWAVISDPNRNYQPRDLEVVETFLVTHW